MTRPVPAAANLPDVVVFGVGHSGTSIVARMLFELGWQRNDADERFCEPPALREINDRLLSPEMPDATMTAAMREYLEGLRRPFALKDPRLVVTLSAWMPLLGAREPSPVLLWITRGLESLKASYAARDERAGDLLGGHGHSVEALCALAEQGFAAWSGAKLEVAYERVARAVALFRTTPGERHPLGGLWS